MRTGEAATDRGRLRQVRTDALTASEIQGIRELLWAAFPPGDDEFTEDDWRHAIGGVHFVLDLDGQILAHASVVQRELHVGERPLRTGYVEAVAMRPAQQGTGLGTRVMRDVTSYPGALRARRPRHRQPPFLRAPRLADVARSHLRADRCRRPANARRGRLHHGAAHAVLTAPRSHRPHQLRVAAGWRLVTLASGPGTGAPLVASMAP